jgi:hypothetical protein
MLVMPQIPNLPYAGIHPSTDSLRRENSAREPIPQAAEVKAYPPEKPISEGEKTRNTNTGSEQNVQENRQQSEQARTTINDNGGQQQGQQQEQSHQGAEQHEQHASGNDGHHDDQPSPEDLHREQLIKELILRDKEVRAHERAHDSAGGSYTGSPSYVLQRGPDGKSYAVGGEVSVDMSSVPGDPKATIQKMQRVRAAALAPASPSVQDQKVAASAQRIIAQMQMEMLNSSQENFRGGITNVNPAETFDEVEDVVFGSSADERLAEIENAVFGSDQPAQKLQSVEDAVFHEAPTKLHTVEEAVFGFGEQQAPRVRDLQIVSRALRIENFYHQTSRAQPKSIRTMVV